MKLLRITVFVLFALNLLMPAIQSCNKDSSKNDKTEARITMESLVEAYNKNVVLEYQKAQLLEGEMTLVTLPSREALFFLKKAGESDYDIFLCQGTELSSAAQKELGKVKVAYLREALAIETSEGDIYTFTIGSRKGHEIIQKVVPYWSGKGYGLALNNNRADGPLDYKGLSSTDDLRASSCKCRLYHDPNDDSDCDSGGIGASSCSIGGTSTDPGCSVSCASDVAGSTYYACCQTE